MASAEPSSREDPVTSPPETSSGRSIKRGSGKSSGRLDKGESGGDSKQRKAKKKDDIQIVTTILGARKSEENDETPSRLGSANSPPPTTSAASLANPTMTPAKDKHSRASEPIQLLRPPTDNRDASAEAVNILDSRFELVRDLASVEKALVSTNPVFRVFGAIGAPSSGKSSALDAVTTTTKVSSESFFTPKSNGLEVFVHSVRRLVLVEFPSVCAQSTKKSLEPPVFASQYRDVSKLYDLRVAFTALVTCTILYVCVVDECEEDDPIFQLLRAAAVIANRRGWPCAKVVLVRSKVATGQSSNARRIQADERTLRSVLPDEISDIAVVHVPKTASADKECLDANRRIARIGLASFAVNGVSVPVPSKVLSRCTEAEWLSSLVYVFNESRTHPFFSLGEDIGYLR